MLPEDVNGRRNVQGCPRWFLSPALGCFLHTFSEGQRREKERVWEVGYSVTTEPEGIHVHKVHTTKPVSKLKESNGNVTEGLRPNNGQHCSDVWYSLGNSILCPTKGTTKQELLVLPSSEREYPFKKGESPVRKGKERIWQFLDEYL